MSNDEVHPYRDIAYEVDEGVATITLDRPDHLNAFTVTMANELLDAFDRVDADDDVRVVVVTGRGRGFCAGADLSGGAGSLDVTKAPDDVPDRHRDLGGMIALRIFRCLKPVIGAINGPAVGVGITMTLPMDVRFLAEGAKVGFVFAGRGIAPDAASSWFLPRIVGISTALEWALTARVFRSDEALRAGLVRSVHPPDEVLGVARELAREIAVQAAPVSAALTRQMLWRMLGVPGPMDAHRLDSKIIGWASQQDDAYEGITAFLEKRPARWTMTVSEDLPEWLGWREEEPFEVP